MTLFQSVVSVADVTFGDDGVADDGPVLSIAQVKPDTRERIRQPEEPYPCRLDVKSDVARYAEPECTKTSDDVNADSSLNRTAVAAVVVPIGWTDESRPRYRCSVRVLEGQKVDSMVRTKCIQWPW